MIKNKFLVSPAFIFLFAINFIFFSCFTSLNMLPAYLSSIGAGKAFIGFFMNVNSLETVLFVIIFGRYSNMINKKFALIAGFSIFIISLLLMFMFSGNLLVLLCLRIIGSVSYVFGYTLITNIFFEIIPVETRTSSIALFGISGILSNPFGAFLGETVLKGLHPRYLFLLAACLAVTELIMFIFLKIKKNAANPESSTLRNVLKIKKIRPFIINAFITGGLFSVFVSFIPRFTLERIGVSTLSLYFVSFSTVAVIGRIFFSGFIDGIERKKMIIIALITMFISLVLMLFLFNKYELLLIGLFHGIGHSIMYPVLNTSVLDCGEDDQKAILNNTFILFYTLGGIVLATVLGFIGDIFDTVSIFISMICVIIISSIITVKYFYSRHS
jgi:MFS family permease